MYSLLAFPFLLGLFDAIPSCCDCRDVTFLFFVLKSGKAMMASGTLQILFLA